MHSAATVLLTNPAIQPWSLTISPPPMTSPRVYLAPTTPTDIDVRATAAGGKATVGGISPLNNVSSFDCTAQLVYAMGTYQNDVIPVGTLVFPLNQVIIDNQSFLRAVATRF